MKRFALVATALGVAALSLTAQSVQVPIFEYDPTFPKPLPETWAIGAIGGMAVDRQDHIYVAQRPRSIRGNERFTGAGDTPPKAECCIPAPPILEFDQSGTLVRSWGGPNGLVYVADRTNNRIQVFRKDGTYVNEVFVAKRTLLLGAASGFALSTDSAQRFLYMIDGANHHVWILERQSLKILARFGQQGLWGGFLNVPHAITVDGRGNVYVGENFDARRFQRFLYKGLGTPKAGTIPPTTIVR